MREDRSLTSVRDLTREEIERIHALAVEQKARLAAGGTLEPVMRGKHTGMIFEKPSLRTRVSFEVATRQLGGAVTFLGRDEVGLGKREAVRDFARVLSRYVDLIVARTFRHEHIEEIAAESRVPVINALSDYLHPCQALGDTLTIREHLGDPAGLKVCFIGDGNNVARSLALACGALGMRFVLAAPEGYGFDESFLRALREYAPEAEVETGTDPKALVRGADVVYTDVWASMGQEAEAAERDRIFRPFQLNGDLMRLASERAIAMHCLPAHRGQEITDEVMDGPQSAVYDQAENRLHAQRALMTLIMA